MDMFTAKESLDASSPTREGFQTDQRFYKLDTQTGSDGGASIRSERSGSSTLLDGDGATEQISKMQQLLRDSDVAYLCLSRAYTQKTQAMREEYEVQINELRQENDQLKLKSPKMVQTLRCAVTDAKAQSKVAEQVLAAAHERAERLQAENEVLSKKHQAAQRSASEYSDLVKQFQSMLAECQVESGQKIRELMAATSEVPVSKSCSKCKFMRHTEAGHAQGTTHKLKIQLWNLQTACNETKTRVQTLETTCMQLREEAYRAGKRADYWMKKSQENATHVSILDADDDCNAPVSPITVTTSPASDKGHWESASVQNIVTRSPASDKGNRESASMQSIVTKLPASDMGLRECASMQTIVTRPDCELDALEETPKAPKFWLRPLNRISSTLAKRPGRTGTFKGLRLSSRSTPNLKATMMASDQAMNVPATPQTAVFVHGLATPGASPSIPSFAKFPVFDC